MEKIRDTKLGRWLQDKHPFIHELTGDLLPDAGALGVVKRLIETSGNDPDGIKLTNEMMQTMEQETSKRWVSDNEHQLTRTVRPLVVLISVATCIVFALLEGLQIIVMNSAYISLFETLVMTSVGGYFVLRTTDKWHGGRKA